MLLWTILGSAWEQLHTLCQLFVTKPHLFAPLFRSQFSFKDELLNVSCLFFLFISTELGNWTMFLKLFSDEDCNRMWVLRWPQFSCIDLQTKQQLWDKNVLNALKFEKHSQLDLSALGNLKNNAHRRANGFHNRCKACYLGKHAFYSLIQVEIFCTLVFSYVPILLPARLSSSNMQPICVNFTPDFLPQGKLGDIKLHSNVLLCCFCSKGELSTSRLMTNSSEKIFRKNLPAYLQTTQEGWKLNATLVGIIRWVESF